MFQMYQWWFLFDGLSFEEKKILGKESYDSWGKRVGSIWAASILAQQNLSSRDIKAH